MGHAKRGYKPTNKKKKIKTNTPKTGMSWPLFSFL